MQLLPHYEKAVISIEKLRNYVLDPNHRAGKHKARVFKAALGIESVHSDAFAQLLKSSLGRSPAVRGLKDRHGERWTTYNEIIGLNGRSRVVTVAWIYRSEREDVPVLITCYLEPQGARKLAEALNAD